MKTVYYDFSQLAPERLNLCKMTFLGASEKKKRKENLPGICILDSNTVIITFKYNIQFLLNRTVGGF